MADGVTIHDVAREAGVSSSTVSNLLNGRTGRMQPATRERVEQAIARLGYRPNPAARQLRTGRNQVIGLVVPSVANPFWGAFAHYLERAALADGHHVLLCNSARDPERERSYLEELWEDGIRDIVLCSSLPSLEHIRHLLDRGLGLVAFDRTSQADDPPTLVNISVDNVIGAQLATKHLVELGHRRLGFVSGSLGTVNRIERYRGFRSALEQAGLAVDEDMIWTGASDEALGDLGSAGLGRRAVRELLDRPEPPTALFAINDMCALGAYAGIRDAGMVVGWDVSVVGFDDIPLARLLDPGLTTVRQSLPEMAAAAFRHLRTRYDRDAPRLGQSLLVRPELVVRRSAGPPNR